MKNNVQYTDSENLTFFLDGELAVTSEATLLDAVNSDEELLRQYREESAINSATRADMGAIPPPELKNELFRKLGYGSNTKPVSIAPISYFKKYVVAAAALLLTTTSVLLYNLRDNTETIKNAVSDATSMAINDEQATETKNIAIEEKAAISNNNATSSEEYAGISADRKNTQKSKASKKAISSASNLASNDLVVKNKAKTSNDEETTIAEIIKNFFIIDKSSLTPIEIQFVAFDGLSPSNNMLTMHPQHFKSLNSGREIGNNELHAQGLNIQQSNDFLINGSFALAYFRNWNGRISVGLEGAYENINKVVFNEDTQQFESPELANASSISALVRYDELALSLFNIHPFVQCQVGLSLNANYVYGGCVGLKYSPMYSNFGLQASYNYKAFQYYYGGTSANSEVFDKNGVAVSLIYRF